jgi:hypothetical protein
MMERIDYWRGFTGGLLAGIAIGTWVYFSPRLDRNTIDSKTFNKNAPDDVSLRRESPESAGDPSLLVPETTGLARMEFDRPRP